MSDSQPVSLPVHLWETLDLMSQEIGVERNALVAQAVFTLARLNGYVVPGKAGSGASGSAGMVPAEQSRSSPSSAGQPAPRSSQVAAKPVKPATRRPPEPEPQPEPDSPPEPEDAEGNPFANDNSNESAGSYGQEPEPEPAPAPKGGKPSLTLVMAGRDPLKMTSEVFTIGRGKTCDFVIDSNRVSREHARILREGAGFVLEDLNSSNGTFYGPNKDKVTRRSIRDQDEFTFGTEKVKFLIRK